MVATQPGVVPGIVSVTKVETSIQDMRIDYKSMSNNLGFSHDFCILGYGLSATKTNGE